MDTVMAYVAAARKEGKTDDEIKEALVRTGASLYVIQAALSGYLHTQNSLNQSDVTLPASALSPPPAPLSTSEEQSATARIQPPDIWWIGFIHAALYMSIPLLAMSIIGLGTNVIKSSFTQPAINPGDMASNYVSMYMSFYDSSITRWEMALGLVALPLFAISHLYLVYIVGKYPEIAVLKIRLWLAHITMVVALASIVGAIALYLSSLFGKGFVQLDTYILSLTVLVHGLILFFCYRGSRTNSSRT